MLSNLEKYLKYLTIGHTMFSVVYYIFFSTVNAMTGHFHILLNPLSYSIEKKLTLQISSKMHPSFHALWVLL